nr:MAG TPA: hypothetical protein [Caudoviricetes sp.]
MLTLIIKLGIYTTRLLFAVLLFPFKFIFKILFWWVK